MLEKGIEAVAFEPRRLFSRGFVERNPGAVEEFSGKRPVSDPSCYAKAALAMSNYNYNAELDRICCPTLIIVGDEDILTPPGGSVRMSRLIPGSKLVILKGCGHVPYVEEPEVFSKEILGSLAEANV